MSYCPLVERLGFDENFVDVTEMVDTKVKQTLFSDLTFSGHIYNEECECTFTFRSIKAGSVVFGHKAIM